MSSSHCVTTRQADGPESRRRLRTFYTSVRSASRRPFLVGGADTGWRRAHRPIVCVGVSQTVAPKTTIPPRRSDASAVVDLVVREAALSRTVIERGRKFVLRSSRAAKAINTCYICTRMLWRIYGEGGGGSFHQRIFFKATSLRYHTSIPLSNNESLDRFREFLFPPFENLYKTRKFFFPYTYT